MEAIDKFYEQYLEELEMEDSPITKEKTDEGILIYTREDITRAVILPMGEKPDGKYKKKLKENYYYNDDGECIYVITEDEEANVNQYYFKDGSLIRWEKADLTVLDLAYEDEEYAERGAEIFEHSEMVMEIYGFAD